MEESCFFQFSGFSILAGKSWNGENWNLAGRGAKLWGNYTGNIWKNMGLGAISYGFPRYMGINLGQYAAYFHLGLI